MLTSIYSYHLNLSGLSRLWTHAVSAWQLSRAVGSMWGLLPDSLGCMSTAWQLEVLLGRGDIPRPQSLIDIGANNGQMARILHKMMPPGSPVLSVEPNPACRPLGVRLPYALAAAPSATPGTLWVPHRAAGCARLVSVPKAGDGEGTFLEVPVTSFAELVRTGVIAFSELPPPRLIKIDVEGAELQVLRGMGEYLLEKPMLLIELTNRSDLWSAEASMELVSLLAEGGYTSLVILYASHDGSHRPAYLDLLAYNHDVSFTTPRS